MTDVVCSLMFIVTLIHIYKIAVVLNCDVLCFSIFVGMLYRISLIFCSILNPGMPHNHWVIQFMEICNAFFIMLGFVAMQRRVYSILKNPNGQNDYR